MHELENFPLKRLIKHESKAMILWKKSNQRNLLEGSNQIATSDEKNNPGINW
jgi:hypothetical protein